MKKLLIIALSAMMLIATTSSAAQVNKTDNNQALYEETVIRLIYPVMLDVVSQVHGKQTMLDYESMDVNNIKMDENNNLILELKLKPFTSPHKTLSTDYVTLRISTFEVQIINYESSTKKSNETEMSQFLSNCDISVFLFIHFPSISILFHCHDE